MTELDKGEVYDAVHSDFWQEVAAKLEEEKTQAISDIAALDFTIPESNYDAISCQAKIEMINKIFEIVDEIKETAREEK